MWSSWRLIPPPSHVTPWTAARLTCMITRCPCCARLRLKRGGCHQAMCCQLDCFWSGKERTSTSASKYLTRFAIQLVLGVPFRAEINLTPSRRYSTRVPSRELSCMTTRSGGAARCGAAAAMAYARLCSARVMFDELQALTACALVRGEGIASGANVPKPLLSTAPHRR